MLSSLLPVSALHPSILSVSGCLAQSLPAQLSVNQLFINNESNAYFSVQKGYSPAVGFDCLNMQSCLRGSLSEALSGSGWPRCVYPCLYAQVHMYVCAHAHVYMCVSVYMSVCVHMHVCLCLCAYTHLCVCLYVCLSVHVCVCISVCVCACLYACMCACVRACLGCLLRREDLTEHSNSVHGLGLDRVGGRQAS